MHCRGHVMAMFTNFQHGKQILPMLEQQFARLGGKPGAFSSLRIVCSASDVTNVPTRTWLGKTLHPVWGAHSHHLLSSVQGLFRRGLEARRKRGGNNGQWDNDGHVAIPPTHTHTYLVLLVNFPVSPGQHLSLNRWIHESSPFVSYVCNPFDKTSHDCCTSAEF